MKKIDIIVFDFSKSGGIEQFCFDLKCALDADKYEVRLVSLFKSGEIERVDADVLYLNCRGYKNTLFDLLRSIFLLKSKTKNTDLFVHCFNNIFILHALFAFSKLGCFLYTEHSSYDAVRRHIRFIINFLLPFVAAIICQTDYSLRKYSKLGLKNLYKLPPSFVDLSLVNLPSTSNGGILKIAFVGRLEEQKGVLEFLNIGKHLIKNQLEIELHIFGTGSLHNEIETWVTKNNFNDFFFLHGFKNSWNINNLNLDFVFLLSKSESFSIVGIEALASGIGVVSYDDLVGPREYLNFQNSLMVKRGMGENYCLNMYLDLKRLKKSKDFRKNCINSVINFSRDSFNNGWCEVLDNVSR